MNAKLAYVFAMLSLMCVMVDCSFIKPNNVPRVGRSNEADGPYDMENGYVIKSNKNIPRMGRRNYDSENRYDIPKFYDLPSDRFDSGEQSRYIPEQIGKYYEFQMENMKK
ncbi:uncharacterized protein LOC128681344 [Plodia interpunctella]|uniref:uncharacterized protein LOC128681344 n=1 Tax=Plodia interpunctella TaxID=58824 RepID=UPI0023682A94|nr:uncharacterized protein LOC128681344 [Plodia interpunctella]